MDALLWSAYAASTLALGAFGIHRLWLLSRFRWRTCRDVSPPCAPLPIVTVQLPLYNESTVASRVIRACAALEYPRDRLELQVLDDSTDETQGIVEAEVELLRSQGVNAVVLRRSARSGFKAGALAHGQRHARGELLCIFDADFVPEPDFLMRVVGAFEDARVGMVQMRWGHLNRDGSWFTRAQAALLDGHFVITHKVRFERDLFFHFNGTAGVWRRTAIERAGGWQHDTLTEDLDLSYRAQIAGERLVYLHQYEAPAELPADIAAFKTQQTRWARGAVQVGRKLARTIAAADLRPRVKFEAAVHFLSHAGHPLVLGMALVLPLAGPPPPWLPSPGLLALPALSMPAALAFYSTSLRVLGRPLGSRLLDSFLALILGLGMSWTLTGAVLRGLAPGTGVFVRTPKRGSTAAERYRVRMHALPGFELLLAGWSAWGALRMAREESYAPAFFLVLYAIGFLWVGAMSLGRHLRRSRPLLAASSSA